MSGIFDKRDARTQHRIDALRTWLREESGAVPCSLKDLEVLKKIVGDEEAEQLGRELVDGVRTNRIDIDKIKELISSGANVNLQNDEGMTALMYASLRRHKEVVEVLIGSGAEVDSKGKDGMTALMSASLRSGCKEIVDVLIRNGADVNLEDNKGRAAIDYTSNEDIKRLLDAAKGQK